MSIVTPNYDLVKKISRFCLAFKHSEQTKEILDTYSNHQIDSKIHLVEELCRLGIIRSDSNVFVMACWYCNVFVDLLADHVNHITGYDFDPTSIEIGKSLNEHDNVTLDNTDVMKCKESRFDGADVIINTSCEHMQPMNTWRTFEKLPSGTYFAFQSNNMFDIDTHINCVETIDDFIMQMPIDLEILFEDEIEVPGWEYNNGKRFTIIGKKC